MKQVGRVQFACGQMDDDPLQQRTAHIPAEERGEQCTQGRNGSQSGEDAAHHLLWRGKEDQGSNQHLGLRRGDANERETHQVDDRLIRDG